MNRLISIVTNMIILSSVILAGCTSTEANPPSSPAVNPDYTAAAKTIAAQLTEIAGPGALEPTIDTTTEIPVPPDNITATETLPNTSTPLPTRTSLPNNPLTVTQTSTLAPIIPGTALPSLAADDPKAGLGDPDFSDDFVDGSNWFVGNDEHVNIEIHDNQLSMTALNADKYEAMRLSTQPIIDDFYMEVTTTTGECSGSDRYGLIFRAPGFTPIQGYLFGFTCDGMFSLRIFDGVNFTAIIQWTRSEIILAGSNQTNLIGISAVGQELKLYANGKPLLELQDDRFSSGYFGLFISAYSTPGFRTSYSDFAYWLQP